MKLLVVHPGAAWATADVWAGLLPALQRAGAEVAQYALDGRIQHAGGYLQWCWRRNKCQGEKPSEADVLYLASMGLLERALRLQPDWTLIISAMYVHQDALRLMRRAGQRVAILFTESPYADAVQIQQAAWVNACWVNERASVEPFRAVNPQTYYWQHAIDPARHFPRADADDAGPDAPAHDVVFVGTGWQERCELLSAINWDGIDLGLYGAWGLLGSRAKLRRYVRGGITANAMTAALYRRAKIGLNLHRASLGWGRASPRVSYAESLNPRCYELGATGCFFITDYRAELADVYGDAVPTFTSPREAEGLIRYFLARPDERRLRAARLPSLARAHTFDARARQMITVLQSI